MPAFGKILNPLDISKKAILIRRAGMPVDAVVKPSTQKLLKSFDLKVEYFETVVATGILT